MGRQRGARAEQTQAQEGAPPTATEEEVAALVAAILVGTAVVPNPTLAIAEALLNLVPSFLPTPVAARISADVARLVSEDRADAPEARGANLATHRSNLAYRALYAVQAVKRIVEAVRGPSETPLDERLAKAFSAERSYLEAHMNASRRRSNQAAVLEALANVYGPVLSWNHSAGGKTHRPSHLSADGKNFRIDSIPKKTGAFPGMEPNCHCFAGPPIPNAKTMD